MPEILYLGKYQDILISFLHEKFVVKQWPFIDRIILVKKDVVLSVSEWWEELS